MYIDGFIIFIIFIILIILILVIKHCYFTDGSTHDHDQDIRILGRQTLRWSTASRQDQNPFIAVLHANYGMAYWSAMKDIASEKDIERVLGVDISDIAAWVVTAQDAASKRAINTCPEFGPSVPEFVRRLSGE